MPTRKSKLQICGKWQRTKIYWVENTNLKRSPLRETGQSWPRKFFLSISHFRAQLSCWVVLEVRIAFSDQVSALKDYFNAKSDQSN